MHKTEALWQGQRKIRRGQPEKRICKTAMKTLLPDVEEFETSENDKCGGCGISAAKCPKKIIIALNGEATKVEQSN